MKQTVRIIGGMYRGKKLPFPDINGLRPTPDRVKETLFNWLMHDIRDAKCLDAFAGSGALGFEAFSRGAKQVIFVDSSQEACKNLKQVANSFNSDKLVVKFGNAQEYLQQTKESFDIIFLDPPFAENYLSECLNLLTRSTILAVGGLVYIESAQKQTIDSTQWQEKKLKQAGQVVYGLYKKLKCQTSK